MDFGLPSILSFLSGGVVACSAFYFALRVQGKIPEKAPIEAESTIDEIEVESVMRDEL